MAEVKPQFEPAAAHRWFSADCFNRVWALLEKAGRTPAEDERMISLCHASLAHWRERMDCTTRNLSIGYWQLSRVYAVLGHTPSRPVSDARPGPLRPGTCESNFLQQLPSVASLGAPAAPSFNLPPSDSFTRLGP